LGFKDFSLLFTWGGNQFQDVIIVNGQKESAASSGAGDYFFFGGGGAVNCGGGTPSRLPVSGNDGLGCAGFCGGCCEGEDGLDLSGTDIPPFCHLIVTRKVVFARCTRLFVRILTSRKH
jgi:hypothetical protein